MSREKRRKGHPLDHGRRHFMATGLAGLGSSLALGLGARRASGAPPSGRAKHCIVLYMHGGASHIDTFDPKPGTPSGGSFAAIGTKVPGIQICEHLPKIAARMDRLALIRSLTAKEGNHARARYLMHTGFVRQGGVEHPGLGAWTGRALGAGPLPRQVAVAGPGQGGGFLGPAFDPFTVPRPTQPVRNLGREDALPARESRREAMLAALEGDFAARHAGVQVDGSRAVTEAAIALSHAREVEAFDLSKESAKTRKRYGEQDFGAGCLMARRLIERGVPFVEVSLRNWDTHEDNFARVERLCGELDQAWSALIDDLQANGKWKETLVVWMGDFGRTPKINARGGRDHWPHASSVVLGGGVVRGGQVWGATDAQGARVADAPVQVADLYATLAAGLGLVAGEMHMTPRGRPVTTVDEKGRVLDGLLRG